MIRRAFRMSVHAGQAQEYERRHRPIWQELEDTLTGHGVATYSIFLDEATNDLFAYAEFESDERWAAVASTAVCQRWWQYMSDVMPSHTDHSPIASELREVFHIDNEEDAQGS